MKKNTKKWLGISLALILFLVGFYLYHYYPQFIPGLAGVNTEINRDINVVFFGLDDMDSVREGEIEADSIILASYKHENDSIKMKSISPEIEIDEKKLKEYSTEEAMENIENIVNEKGDYYFSISYKGFIEFIDKIDGVELNLDEEMKVSDLDLDLDKGNNVLSGEEALNYARWYGYDFDKIERMKRQKKLIKAIIDKLVNEDLLTNIPNLYSTIVETYQMVETNMDQQLISDLVKLFQDKENIEIEYEIVQEK